MSIYDFNVRRPDGQIRPMEEYKGKVMLIVNTASRCGYTPQYAGLEELYKKYKDSGLVVLGFPCNQFAGQEPRSIEEVVDFCKVNYGVSFPIFDKVNVNGIYGSPLFKYLKEKQPFDPTQPIPKEMSAMYKKANRNYALSPNIKWNFTKFLVNQKGTVTMRFEPHIEPKEIEPYIRNLLHQGLENIPSGDILKTVAHTYKEV